MGRAPQKSGAFGRYLLIEQLGQGGMAQLWRARRRDDADDGAEVVVKTLHPRLMDQPLFAELFRAEARITRLLAHPGIVRLVDDGEVKGMPYLALERIDGWDLCAINRALPAGCTIPVEVALSVAVILCRALGYAHDWRDERGRPRPIVHGDLSPSNLMVRRDGGVALIDFGVAHMDPRVARGRAHLVIGKSGYLAPELLDDAIAGTRSDVFSAGVVLHELLVGRHLFAVQSERETLRRLTEEPIAPPSASNARVPAALDAIVLRALSRDPRARFANATELADALERLPTPARATRREVAAFVLSLFADAPRSDESVTCPIAPAVPAVLAAQLLMHPVVRQSTATISGRRRRPIEDATAPPRRRRAPRLRGAIFDLAMFAAAALLAAAVVAPVARAQTDWLPLIPIAPSQPLAAAEPPPPPPPSASPSPSPSPALAAPPPPSRRPISRHRKHTRSARSRHTVATGRVVDPFHAH
jgi:eukaryotic-like serine/threonine-protein kinase